VKKVHIYTDGSFTTLYPKYSGWGMVAIDDNGNVLGRQSGVLQGAVSTMRQIGGELKGAMIAVKWAIINNYDKVIIHYDYEGVKQWGEGNWKAKKTWTAQYSDYMINIKNIKVEFKHVGNEHHQGFNQMADTLANNAIISAAGKDNGNIL